MIGKTLKRLTALIRIIFISGLAASSGYLALLMLHDKLPWTTPNTHHLGRCNWYVWSGKLFIHQSFDVDKPECAVREFRIGGLRAKREAFSLCPDDAYGQPDESLEPERYVATILWQTPTWPLLLLLGFYPALVLVLARKRRRDHRRRRGLCVRCSYNLTGNTSGVCPECGART